MFPSYSNEVTINKSTVLLTHLHVNWDTTSEFIVHNYKWQIHERIKNDTNMDRLAAAKFIYNVQVPPWAPIRLPVPYLHVLTEVQSVFSCSQQRVQHSLLHLLPLNQHRLPMVLFSQQERLNKRRWEASLQSYSSVQKNTVHWGQAVLQMLNRGLSLTWSSLPQAPATQTLPFVSGSKSQISWLKVKMTLKLKELKQCICQAGWVEGSALSSIIQKIRSTRNEQNNLSL